MARPLSRYRDPLDHVWLDAAARLGLRVRRDPGAYASTDGRGTLTVAPDEDLDPDDCLAQIILHELCHSLVQGEGSFQRPDWGLSNDETAAAYFHDAVREHACLRLQAALLRRHGLRRLLAPTTDFREYYDALPEDPLAARLRQGPGDGEGEVDPAAALAREGLGRAARAPYARVLGEALTATATIHRLLSGCEVPEPGPPSLWRLAPAPARHASGLPLGDGCFGPGAATCGTCAWRSERAGVSRCRRSIEKGERGAVPKEGVRVDPAARACVLHEPALSCQACAACCREAYDLVPLRRTDAVVRRHPEWVQAEGKSLHLRRDPGRNACIALGQQGPEGDYACAIYEDRPQTCRDFQRGGESCLQARRRVGLSL